MEIKVEEVTINGKTYVNKEDQENAQINFEICTHGEDILKLEIETCKDEDCLYIRTTDQDNENTVVALNKDDCLKLVGAIINFSQKI